LYIYKINNIDMSMCLEIEPVWLSILSAMYCTPIYPCTYNECERFDPVQHNRTILSMGTVLE